MAGALRGTVIAVFGLATIYTTVTARAEVLIPFESDWMYLHPTSEAEDPAATDNNFNSTWFEPNYDVNGAVSWSGPAAGPFSRGTISSFTPTNSRFIREANTILTQPESGGRLSAFFRHEFTTTESTEGFLLDLIADDGARVYLDGEQILSVNCCTDVADGAPTAFTDTALGVGEERFYTPYRVLSGESLSAGDHVLAVAVHNRSASDSDLAFSMRLSSGLVDLVDQAETWQYFEGFEEPAGGTLDWTMPSFDTTDWSNGQEPFGYEESGVGDPTGVFDMVDPATLLDMQGAFTTLYIRKQFSVSDTEELGELTLSMDYDDAFFAYINGQLVFSSEATHPLDDPNLPIPFDLDGVAAGFDHESTNDSTASPDLFTARLSDFPGLLNEGDDNVLAIQGFNRAPDSSDFLMAKISMYATPGGGTPAVPGDFDEDGQLTAADIDLLTGEVRAGGNNPFFDVTGDGIVDEADRVEWVEVLKFTYFGDSNLDLQFSSADLVTVLTSGEYEDATPLNSGWATGDWNGDGDFTSADFVTALTGGSYEQGPRATVAAVPEPTGLVLLLFGYLGLLVRRPK